MSRRGGTTSQATAPSQQNAIIYARVSSKEQEREGFSIDAQLKLLREYAQKHGFTVVEEYIDVETAKRTGRKGFNDLVAFLKRQSSANTVSTRCRVVLVEKTDRLYRNFKDWVTLDVDEMDLAIHLVKEGAILSPTSRSHEKFIHGIKVLMAKNYVDNLSEETRKGMLEKAEQGIFPTKAPLGYTNTGEGGKRIIVPDPERAPIVRRIFEWYSTGNSTLLEVTRMARSAGLIYRRRGDTIPKSAIHAILRNPVYYGDFRWGGKLYHGTHEPLISKDLWEKVQHVLDGKGNGTWHYQKHEWAFQGLVNCGHCGCVLTAELKKQKYVYYHCTGGRGKCGEKYVREEELAAQFGNALRAIQIGEEVVTHITSALKASHKDEKQFHDMAIARLQAEYTRIQQRIDAMYEDKLDGRITQDLFERKHLEWNDRLQELEREILRHRNANHAYIEEGALLLDLARRAAELYDQQPLHEKRRVLEAVLSNSTYSVGQLRPVYRKPFDMLVQPRDVDQTAGAASVPSDPTEIWLPD